MRKSTAPSAAEREQLRELNRLLQLGTPALIAADGKETIELPQAVYSLLRDIVHEMQYGRAVLVAPEEQQLSTQRAADLLGVSRPHLVRLLQDGVLPFHTVGSHRRVYLADVVAFAQRRDANRRAALDDLSRDAFVAGLYDHTGIPEGGTDE